MPEYRRLRVPGGCYFFTVNLRDRGSRLLLQHIELFREIVRNVRRDAPFHIDAWVILPDHMHFKKQFSKAMPMIEPRSPVMLARRERAIWQRRYWEHLIRNENDYARHMDYVHFNPVKHGLAQHPADWPHSTFRHATRAGYYPERWAPDAGTIEGQFGE